MTARLPLLTRRRFLLGGLATGAAAMTHRFLPGGRALADAGPTKRRFVFLYLPGGWDQLLFLDPREMELAAGSESEYRAEVERTGIDTRYRFSGYEYATTADYGESLHRPTVATDPGFHFGPAAVRMTDGAPLRAVNLPALVDRGVPMGIVRGINMGTLGHEPGYLYFLTGEPSVGTAARGTSMPIRLAGQLNALDPALGGTLLPTVALSVSSYTGEEDGRLAALRASSVDDLGRILARPEALREPPAIEAALAAHADRPLGEAAQRYDTEGLLSSLAGSSRSVRAMLDDDLAATFGFLDADDEASRTLRARYGIAGVESSSDRRSAAVSAAFVSLAVKTGFAQFISAALPAGGDTHGAGNRVHARGLHSAIDAIARLVDDLATTPADAALGGSWMDHTTICVFSEFARTPRCNATGGRDHHFTSSCLLIGAGVRPGSVAGASSETGGMNPLPFDFAAQEVLGEGVAASGPDQRAILPEDIGASLLASAELRYDEYRNGSPLWRILDVAPY